MKRRQPDFSRQSERLQSYLDSLTRTVGHADRVVPHRSLRLPGAGAVPFSPSARFAANAGSEPPSSLTPCAKQLRAPRLCRCEPNGIIPARSPPFGARLQPTWPAPCPDAPAACEISYNTVVLGTYQIVQCGNSRFRASHRQSGSFEEPGRNVRVADQEQDSKL